MIREGVNSPKLAPPVGPFSHMVKAGDLVFFSGQVGQDPATGTLVVGDVTAQATQIFANLTAILPAVGASMDQVVKVTVYLTDIQDFAALNAVYAQQFTEPFPARTTIAVVALPLGARVELDVIARLA